MSRKIRDSKRDQAEDALSELGEKVGWMSRRGFIGGTGASAVAAMLGAFGAAVPMSLKTAQAQGGPAFGKPLKCAMSNAGLGATWCAQGKAAAEQWGKWLGIEINWYDGALSIDKQRKAIDDMATKQWDFVAIQAFGIDTLVDPVKQMISKGIPVVQMDTTISKDDPGILTFLEPDNILMGGSVSTALFQKMGGKGNVIMTQGALGHTGARGRAAGFKEAIKAYPNIKVLAEDPADWDVNKVAKLWEDYLVKYPSGQIQGGMFHNDDMALAAARVIKNAGRDKEIALVGVDAMPPAVEAVVKGSLTASIRNPSSRIHWGAVVIGGLVASGQIKAADVPKYILMDGPLVTPKIGPGLLFMQKTLLA